jgi:ketosteroid isomerase-like protein
MKNKVIQGLALSFLMSLIIACNAKKTETVTAVIDKEKIKKEIQAKEDEFASVYNSGEMKNIGYYADDATTFAQNSQPLVGKTAIINYLKANIDSLDKANKISFTTKEVFVSNDANLVLEIGYYKVVDAANTPVNAGNYMVLFEKRDGNYFSIRDMSASDGTVK